MAGSAAGPTRERDEGLRGFEMGGLDPAAVRAAVLVEGASDRLALETLAKRRGRDLQAEGIAIIAMGGATNIGHALEVFGPQGLDVRLAGLCDAGEVGAVGRGLQRAGLTTEVSRADLEQVGFHVCVADLEDELIRSLGVAAVIGVIADQDELRSLRTFQKQPAQQDRTVPQQLRRFMGTRSGRKTRYGVLLVQALDLAHVPRPLDRVLAAV